MAPFLFVFYLAQRFCLISGYLLVKGQDISFKKEHDLGDYKTEIKVFIISKINNKYGSSELRFIWLINKHTLRSFNHVKTIL